MYHSNVRNLRPYKQIVGDETSICSDLSEYEENISNFKNFNSAPPSAMNGCISRSTPANVNKACNGIPDPGLLIIREPSRNCNSNDTVCVYAPESATSKLVQRKSSIDCDKSIRPVKIARPVTFDIEPRDIVNGLDTASTHRPWTGSIEREEGEC